MSYVGIALDRWLRFTTARCQHSAVRPHSTASCFTTYLLPEVLFVADFEERQRITKVCCLAWNIGLFPDADDREHHVGKTLDLFFSTGEVPPPGFRAGYGEELLMLADRKRDLFPWQFGNVMHAGLEPGRRADILVVDTGEAVERIEVAREPPIAGLPYVTKVLVKMQQDTKAQRATLEKARRTPGLIEQVATRDMLTTYCVQRAELRGYYRMFTAWREALPEANWKSGVERFLLAIDEIEDDTKAVLGIFAVALSAP